MNSPLYTYTSREIDAISPQDQQTISISERMNGNTIRASISRKINVKATKYTVQKSFTYMADKKFVWAATDTGSHQQKYMISAMILFLKKKKEKGATAIKKTKKKVSTSGMNRVVKYTYVDPSYQEAATHDVI